MASGEASELREEDKELIDEFVVHLIVRTRNVRLGFTEIGTGMFKTIEKGLRNPEMRQRIGRLIRE